MVVIPPFSTTVFSGEIDEFMKLDKYLDIEKYNEHCAKMNCSRSLEYFMGSIFQDKIVTNLIDNNWLGISGNGIIKIPIYNNPFWVMDVVRDKNDSTKIWTFSTKNNTIDRLRIFINGNLIHNHVRNDNEFFSYSHCYESLDDKIKFESIVGNTTFKSIEYKISDVLNNEISFFENLQ